MSQSQTTRIQNGRDLLPFLYTVGVFTAISIVVQLAAIRLATPTGTEAVLAHAQVVSNPQNPINAVGYTIYIVLAGVGILILNRLPTDGVLDYLAAILVWDLSTVIAMSIGGFGPLTAAALGGAFLFAYWEYHPWWLINACAIAFGIYGAAVLGQNFGILPAILVLAGTALYDYIAVFRTGHMLSLADALTSIDAPLPAAIIIPTSTRFFDTRTHELTSEHSVTVGLGDFVIPSLLAVSAAVWTTAPAITLLGVQIPWPALGAIGGVIIGNVGVLYVLARYNRALPGLPFINTGAVIGFLVFFL